MRVERLALFQIRFDRIRLIQVFRSTSLKRSLDQNQSYTSTLLNYLFNFGITRNENLHGKDSTLDKQCPNDK